MRVCPIIFLLCVLLSEHTAQAAGPRVIVSIKPLHALVAAVMAGVSEPELLIKGSASPHAYSLRPSDARMLSDADIVIWIGPSFENFLTAPLATMATHAEQLGVMRAPGVRLLRAREGGVWDAHDDAAASGADSNETDGHLWLDPHNAEAIVRAVTSVLDKRDPIHTARYDANAGQLIARLDALDRELAATLAPMKDKPFIVFHDAYQYFQTRYGVDAVGSVTVSPDREPGARRIAEIRQKIATLGATCIFAEPQFRPKLVTALAADTKARVGVLDPEGTALTAGPDLYFTLMRNLSHELVDCLSR